MKLSIVHAGKGGSVSITHPAPGARLCSQVRLTNAAGERELRQSQARMPLEQLIGRSTVPQDLEVIEGESDVEFAVRTANRCGIGDYTLVPVADLPTDRTRRDAWKMAGGRVVYG